MTQKFSRNVSLDASLVQASMHGGFEAFCSAAMALGIEGGPDVALARAEWFKLQPKEYRDQVIALILREQSQKEGPSR